ncbi:MAG: SDR family oxidoreductase [Flammeovirgaceae bacterium]
MKTALVTGASMGIGYELAKEFAAAKYDLVLVARSVSKLNEIALELTNKYQIKVTVIGSDLSEKNAALKVYNELKTKGIEIDFLVNNAGFGNFGFFKDTDWAKEEMMINLNITALTQFCKLYVPDMVKRGKGKILNVASMAAFQPGPLQAVYFATKAYVLYLSEAIANELESTGVTVTALCPNATESNFASVANAIGKGTFKKKKLPTDQEVAKYGFKAMMEGKVVAIPGIQNYLLAQTSRFVPRKMATKIMRKLQEI